jgi:hypothetical protein
MSGTKKATPTAELERQICSAVEPKNEREWWAHYEIERLRAELAEARRERDRLREAVEVLQKDTYNLTQKVIPNIRKERDNAESELAEARRDAERYRWLRDVACDVPEGIGVARFHGCAREEIVWGDDLDAAIDAARGEA